MIFKPLDTSPCYSLGLDLGQSKDFTALCVLEQHGTTEKGDLLVRHLQRWPLGTSYPDIVADVVKMLEDSVFRRRDGEQPALAVDQTGVGAPVVDMLRQADPKATLVPVHITGGNQINQEKGAWSVPKRDLVGVVQATLQTGRLKVAEALTEAATLQREMQNFQIKVTLAANDVYGAWREGTHDDLVLAVAMALWAAISPQVNPVFSHETWYR